MLTASAWDNTVSTADTPNYAARLGLQTATLLSNVQELCELNILDPHHDVSFEAKYHLHFHIHRALVRTHHRQVHGAC